MARCENCIHQIVCKHKANITESCEHFAAPEANMTEYLIRGLDNMYWLLMHGNKKPTNYSDKKPIHFSEFNELPKEGDKDDNQN